MTLEYEVLFQIRVKIWIISSCRKVCSFLCNKISNLFLTLLSNFLWIFFHQDWYYWWSFSKIDPWSFCIDSRLSSTISQEACSTLLMSENTNNNSTSLRSRRHHPRWKLSDSSDLLRLKISISRAVSEYEIQGTVAHPFFTSTVYLFQHALFYLNDWM